MSLPDGIYPSCRTCCNLALGTALARPVAGMSLSLNYWGADQFLHEAVLRAPHFLIPLYLFFLWCSRSRNAPADTAADTQA